MSVDEIVSSFGTPTGCGHAERLYRSGAGWSDDDDWKTYVRPRKSDGDRTIDRQIGLWEKLEEIREEVIGGELVSAPRPGFDVFAVIFIVCLFYVYCCYYESI